MPTIVYLETTVVSYRAALPSRDLIMAAHQQITHEWWMKVLPEVMPVISTVVVDEISKGDEQAAQVRHATVRGFECLSVTPDVIELANLYRKELKIPDRAAADGLHLALASHYGIDYLLSWNCRHIANSLVREILLSLNTPRRLKTPIICTPEEMLETWNAWRPDR